MSGEEPSEVFFSPCSPTLYNSSGDEAGELNTVLRSIERSRKRHLSEGLLRGDLAADRLTLQELSASPLLKKSRASPSDTVTVSMALTMQDFKKYMDENTNKRLGQLEGAISDSSKKLESVDSAVADLTRTVSKINKNVKLNASKIDKHEETIKENQASIAALRDEMKKIGETALQPRPRATDSTSPGPSQDDRDFDRARRSLRLWPIPGDTEQELWRSARQFLGTKLGLGSVAAESMIEKVTRVLIPSGPGVKQEALVMFRDSGHRDNAMGASGKLSEFIDATNKPTAGIRIEVPPRLRATFRVLFRYGQNLRTRHGPGTRRHIKFDDALQTLFLNIKLPGDERWSRVSFEMARRGIRTRQEADDLTLERRIDIDGPNANQDRSRTTSDSSSMRGTSSRNDTWSARRTESMDE